jgi:hypothetical protein
MPTRKKFEYYVLWKGKTTKLLSDPKGWNETTIGYTRSDDFAINTEYTTPLSFTFDGRDLLNRINETDGIHAEVILTIYKRDNNYQMRQFYRYKLDFTTLADDFETLSISGVEDSLYKYFQDYNEVDYTIDMPSTGDNVLMLNYDGVVTEKENIIQIGFGDAGVATVSINGSIVKKNWLHMLIGKRAVRSYDADLSFVDEAGLPFTTATFKCLNAKRVKIELNIIGDIYLDGVNNWVTSSLFLCKHPTQYMATGYEEVQGTTVSPFSTVVESNNDDVLFRYNNVITFNLDLEEGYYYTLVFRNGNVDANEGDGWDDDDKVSVTDGQDMFMSIKADAVSAFDNDGSGTPMQVFSFEWLLGELVKKIYPDGVVDYDISQANYTDLVAFSNSLLYETNRTIVTNLKDVLKALYVLNNCSINFYGNTMSIRPLEAMYVDSSRATLSVSEISIKSDIEHSYNEVEVGYDTDEKTIEGAVTKPYCQKLTFAFENSKTKKMLDLKCPFMLDMYAIEAYLTEVNSDPENVNDNKIMCFAAENISGTTYGLYRSGQSFSEFSGDGASAYNLPYSTKRILKKHLRYAAVGAPKVATPESSTVGYVYSFYGGFTLPFRPFFEQSNTDFKLMYTTNTIDGFIGVNYSSIRIRKITAGVIFCQAQLWAVPKDRQTALQGFPSAENDDAVLLSSVEGTVGVNSLTFYASVVYILNEGGGSTGNPSGYHSVVFSAYNNLQLGTVVVFNSSNHSAGVPVVATWLPDLNGHRLQDSTQGGVTYSFMEFIEEGDILFSNGVSYEVTYKDYLGDNYIQTTPPLPNQNVNVSFSKNYTIATKLSEGGLYKIETIPSLPASQNAFLEISPDSTSISLFSENQTPIYIESINDAYDIRLYASTGNDGQYARDIEYDVDFQTFEEVSYLPSELKYKSAQIKNANCISQLAYETEAVNEQSDVPMSAIEPLFFPYTATFKTDEQFDTLELQEQDKYEYYEFVHKKTGKIYKGWINNITFAVGEEQEQEWDIQLKSL